VNWNNPRTQPSWMRILGGIARICLFGVGLNFFFNGGLVVFFKGPMTYGDDANFHIGLGLSGLLGFMLFPNLVHSAWSSIFDGTQRMNALRAKGVPPQ
jgi:hypothetical protein